jgi:DNA-directed RNA polymerase subunit RPC12/RpoP
MFSPSQLPEFSQLYSPGSPSSSGEDEIDEPMLPISPPPLPPPLPSQPTGWTGTHKKPPADIDLLVFNVLNIFCRCWFLSRAHLMANTISAQKAEDGKLSWVEFTPHFHSHLVKCAVALVPHPVHKVKRVLFVFILELLNGEGDGAFFELQKGGRKANNAQKEKQCLAQKRNHAAKWEWDRKAAKVVKGPPHFRQCLACGREFTSRKTASRHKCPNSKVVCKPVEAAEVKVS